MLQITVTVLFYLVLVIPVGFYMYKVAAGKHTLLDPVFNRADNLIYRISGVNKKKQMDWKQYTVALVATNGVMILLGYLVLRIQQFLFFNPNGIGNMEETLSLILSSAS